VKPQTGWNPLVDPIASAWPSPVPTGSAVLTQPEPETGNTLHDVEVMETGNHAGDPYSAGDLDDMVSNYASTGGFFTPPLVYGHENVQPLAEGLGKGGYNTGNPAMGWIHGLRNEWRKRPDGETRYVMLARMGDLDDDTADLIQQRKFDKVSPEVYPPDSPDRPPGTKGCVLRRVSLLGGEVPQIKTLASLRNARMERGNRGYSERARRCYSEGRRRPQHVRRYSELTFRSSERSPDGKAVRCYYEAKSMFDREATMAQLKGDPGHPPALMKALEGMADPEFQEAAEHLLKLSTNAGALTAPGIGAYAETKPADPTPDETSLANGVVPNPLAPAVPIALPAAVTADPMNPLTPAPVVDPKKMAEPPITPAAPVVSTDPALVTDPAKIMAECRKMYSETARLHGETKQMLAHNAGNAETARKQFVADRVSRAEAVLKKAVETGVLQPWQNDPQSKVPNARQRIGRLIPDTGVRRYGERNVSEFDLAIEELEAQVAQAQQHGGRVRSYSEKVPDPVKAAAGVMTPERRAELLKMHGQLGEGVLRDERAAKNGGHHNN
jgi:hypothetical protein